MIYMLYIFPLFLIYHLMPKCLSYSNLENLNSNVLNFTSPRTQLKQCFIKRPDPSRIRVFTYNSNVNYQSQLPTTCVSCRTALSTLLQFR
ncbi:hypothetical protein V6Z11_1Z000800 [Gossypium hirsutum]